MSKKDYKIQNSVSNQKKSKIEKYQDLIIGSSKLSDLLKFEFITLFSSWVPGAVGIFLRSKLYPILLGGTGRGVIFGTNIVLRHPKKIFLGDDVIIDDNVLLDAKGEKNKGIFLDDGVFVGRNSILSCKDGDIQLRKRVNMGFNCEIFSSTDVTVGADTLIAAYSYIIGGGGYKLEKHIPINQQPDFEGKGGVIIEENTWIGAHCVILDGVKIGTGSVIAAGAVVNTVIDPMSIAAGVPAKIIKGR